MNASLDIIVIPFDKALAPAVDAKLDAYADPLGSAYKDASRRLEKDGAFVHFMSMVVVPAPKDSQHAHLAIELSTDGLAGDALCQLTQRLAPDLDPIVRATGTFSAGEDLEAHLRRHRVRYSPYWLRQPGLAFVGTPDLPVERIRQEAALAQRIRCAVNATPPGSAQAKLRAVRAEIFADAEYKWAFVCEPIARIVGNENEPPAISRLWTAVRAFAWPLAVLPIVATLAYGIYERGALLTWKLVLQALLCGAVVAAVQGLFVVAALFVGYLRLLREERDDVPRDREPRAQDMEALLGSEDRKGWVQNHLIGVSRLKGGWVRRFTLRIALALIAEGAARNPRPGFLDKIGSIHFARWLRLKHTDQLLFLSNYDGSWQSYLEDFIARLRQGLSSVWSNTRDFPRTTNLVNGGAGDGARFKRWARRQQIPTRFWYSAYPQLTMNRIRTNALIRHGFSNASNEQEAAEWLANFGYAGPESVEFSEIPTLAFGGLSTLGHAHCLLLTLPPLPPPAADANPRIPPPRPPAGDWLQSIVGDLTYGNRKPADNALVVGFTASGLSKLGLDGAALATFPVAFQQGMAHALRARALGDTLETWDWKPGEIDAALLLYHASAAGLAAEVQRRKQELRDHECAVSREIAMAPIPVVEAAPGAPGAPPKPVKEPFGFTDGISQPIMRGTVRGSEGVDQLHTVNPGELVLGYRDNLGMIAPTPRSLGRELGRNGTFLVLRQLEQDPGGFNKYLAETAAALIARNDPRIPPYGTQGELEEWLAAKLLGRWRDGTSLVRHPNEPGSKRPGTRPDNEFLFGREDPDGLRCPLGAHVRRANPRDSFEPSSQLQIDISNRHRILRVGRAYVDGNAANPGDASAAAKGLLFMCVNADIERQFEFLQQSWILGSTFHGLDGEVDPIVGCEPGRAMKVPTPNGPLLLENLAAFVKVLGGGYFFMPSRGALSLLIGEDAPRAPGSYA